MEDPNCGSRLFAADCLGNRIFLTTDIEGEVVPGAKAVEHKIKGEVYVAPTSVGADRKHTPLAGHGMVFVYAGFPAKKTMAIKLGGLGDVTNSNVAWQYDKGTAYVPSSILYGDYIYLMSDRGILTCLEVETGRVVYEGGRIPVPATFTASPVAFDGKLLLSCS